MQNDDNYNYDDDYEDGDYLDEDDVIYNQQFCCVSFAEPKDEILYNKEVFIINKFFKNLFNNYKIEHKHKHVDNEKITEKYLIELYNNFKTTNNKKLCNDFSKENNNTTCIRAIKVRGSYPDEKRARNRANNLSKINKNFNIFIAEVGKWVPFNPININDITAEYQNEKLNELVKGHVDNNKNAKMFFNERKKHMLKKHKKEQKILEEKNEKSRKEEEEKKKEEENDVEDEKEDNSENDVEDEKEDNSENDVEDEKEDDLEIIEA